jgi:23S rRNA pseudouridine955/2504/2580 synthase
MHSGAGVKYSLLDDVKKIYPDAELVHRLDKETSGVVIVAKNKAAIAKWQDILNAGKKTYLAVCRGRFKKDKVFITDPLIIDEKTYRCETRVKVLQGFGDYSLVQAELVTGRKHQIRRHLSMYDHPVLGDDKYGSFDEDRDLEKQMEDFGLFLHAWKLELRKADGGSEVFKAPTPAYFNEILKKYNVRFGFN